MDAVCAESGGQPGVIFNQQRTVGVPGGTKEGRHDRFRMGLRTARQTDERASNRRGFERARENLGEGVGVGSGQKRGDEIERAAGKLGGQGHSQQIGSAAEMSPTIAAKWRSRQGLAGRSAARIRAGGDGKRASLAVRSERKRSAKALDLRGDF